MHVGRYFGRRFPKYLTKPLLCLPLRRKIKEKKMKTVYLWSASWVLNLRRSYWASGAREGRTDGRRGRHWKNKWMRGSFPPAVSRPHSWRPRSIYFTRSPPVSTGSSSFVPGTAALFIVPVAPYGRINNRENGEYVNASWILPWVLIHRWLEY